MTKAARTTPRKLPTLSELDVLITKEQKKIFAASNKLETLRAQRLESLLEHRHRLKPGESMHVTVPLKPHDCVLRIACIGDGVVIMHVDESGIDFHDSFVEQKLKSRNATWLKKWARKGYTRIAHPLYAGIDELGDVHNFWCITLKTGGFVLLHEGVDSVVDPQLFQGLVEQHYNDIDEVLRLRVTV